jgi:hypothetical protein
MPSMVAIPAAMHSRPAARQCRRRRRRPAADGYLVRNDRDVVSINNLTADRNRDGSWTSRPSPRPTTRPRPPQRHEPQSCASSTPSSVRTSGRRSAGSAVRRDPKILRYAPSARPGGVLGTRPPAQAVTGELEDPSKLHVGGPIRPPSCTPSLGHAPDLLERSHARLRLRWERLS